VRLHRRRDSNEVESFPPSISGRVAVKGPSFVAHSRGSRLFKVDVADRREHDVIPARPCCKMIFGKEAAADQADARRAAFEEGKVARKRS
jgi:hypothetical protein